MKRVFLVILILSWGSSNYTFAGSPKEMQILATFDLLLQYNDSLKSKISELESRIAVPNEPIRQSKVEKEIIQRLLTASNKEMFQNQDGELSLLAAPLNEEFDSFKKVEESKQAEKKVIGEKEELIAALDRGCSSSNAHFVTKNKKLSPFYNMYYQHYEDNINNFGDPTNTTVSKESGVYLIISGTAMDFKYYLMYDPTGDAFYLFDHIRDTWDEASFFIKSLNGDVVPQIIRQKAIRITRDRTGAKRVIESRRY